MDGPSSLDPPQQVTRLLGALGAGEASASAELLPLVYDDLRKPAVARMARLAPGQSLQATGEIAELVDLSTRTVGREWRFAKAWLNQRLAEPEGEE